MRRTRNKQLYFLVLFLIVLCVWPVSFIFDAFAVDDVSSTNLPVEPSFQSRHLLAVIKSKHNKPSTTHSSSTRLATTHVVAEHHSKTEAQVAHHETTHHSVHHSSSITSSVHHTNHTEKHHTTTISHHHTTHTRHQNCVQPDIEQFPKSIFNQKQRRHGAVIFHFLVALYMFIGLAIVCDDYFVPSLQYLCKIFNLKEDVAGATFMAAGSSAPELATTIISLFVAKDVDIGISAVVGSAIFNIMFVISIVSLLSGMIISLSVYPLIRDSFFYLIAVLAMILVIIDERVYLYEAIIFLVLYALFIAAMCFNTRLESFFQSRLAVIFTKKPTPGILDPNEFDSSNYNTLKNDQSIEFNVVNGNVNMNAVNGDLDHSNRKSGGGGADSQSNFDEQDKMMELEDEAKDAFEPFKLPGADVNKLDKIRYFVCWPLLIMVYYTIPDCRKRESHKHYIVTFVMSLVWLSLYSYVMLWMITVIGYTFHVPDTVMGVTFIAFGASVPDALGSLLVAKSGLGDMAISNAIGSNVFDILVCLGLPWMIRCMTITGVDYVVVKSRGLTYSAITLFATVIILLLSIHLNKWQLDKKLGVFLMIVYFLFIILSSFYELNILGTNHLPMCLDSKW